jgi:hypothetical protein
MPGPVRASTSSTPQMEVVDGRDKPAMTMPRQRHLAGVTRKMRPAELSVSR